MLIEICQNSTFKDKEFGRPRRDAIMNLNPEILSNTEISHNDKE